LLGTSIRPAFGLIDQPLRDRVTSEGGANKRGIRQPVMGVGCIGRATFVQALSRGLAVFGCAVCLPRPIEVMG
jgi:hypothetical protein